MVVNGVRSAVAGCGQYNKATGFKHNMAISCLLKL